MSNKLKLKYFNLLLVLLVILIVVIVILFLNSSLYYKYDLDRGSKHVTNSIENTDEKIVNSFIFVDSEGTKKELVFLLQNATEEQRELVDIYLVSGDNKNHLILPTYEDGFPWWESTEISLSPAEGEKFILINYPVSGGGDFSQFLINEDGTTVSDSRDWIINRSANIGQRSYTLPATWNSDNTINIYSQGALNDDIYYIVFDSESKSQIGEEKIYK